MNLNYKDLWGVYKKQIVLIAGGIVLIIIIAFTFLSGKNYVTDLIGDMVEQHTEQIMKDYNQRLKDAETKIKESKEQIEITDKNLAKLKKQREELEHEINAIEKPKTANEISKRLDKLGYHPIMQ